MRFVISLVVFAFVSCKDLSKDQTSFWESHKNDVKYHNKTEFESDSILDADLETLKRLNHPLLDSIIGHPVYLYSWQDRDKSKNEFTVVEERGEHGLAIHYLIFNKRDSLISCTQIAGKGFEAEFSFETYSKFISSDTIINIGAITQLWDFDNGAKMRKSKGDTTFSYMIFDNNGHVRVKIFKEVKDLNFESIY